MMKRGQIGKIVTWLPVFLLIFLILALYLIFTGFVSIGSSYQGAIDGADVDNVLLREVEVDGERITLFHGLIKNEFERKKALEEGRSNSYIGKLKKEVVRILEKESVGGEVCFILIQGTTLIDPDLISDGGVSSQHFSMKFVDGRFDGNSDLYSFIFPSLYEGLESRLDFSFDMNGEEREKPLVYYYGRCIDE